MTTGKTIALTRWTFAGNVYIYIIKKYYLRYPKYDTIVIYTLISMEKKYKKAKWLSEEALQIAVKRREAKSKGERKDIPI